MVVRDVGVSYATELPVVAGSQQFGVERHERLVALAHRSPGSREVQLDGQPLVVLSTSPFGDSQPPNTPYSSVTRPSSTSLLRCGITSPTARPTALALRSSLVKPMHRRACKTQKTRSGS